MTTSTMEASGAAIVQPSGSIGEPPVYPVPRLGELLLNGGFLSVDALEEGLGLALKLSVRRDQNRKLGELLVELGHLEQSDLDSVLVIQNDLRSGNTDELVELVGSRLSTILRCSNWIGDSDLNLAFAQMETAGGQLGATLVALGALNPTQQRDALAFQKRLHLRSPERFKLGRMLVVSGAISAAALERAIEHQAQSGKLLGEVLVEDGLISPITLGATLLRQRRLIALAMTGLAILACGTIPAEAEAAGTRVQVMARILSYARLNSARMPSQVSISPADIKAGYVDVEERMEVELKTNNPIILLGVTLNSPVFLAATLSGPQGDSHITPGSPNVMTVSQVPGMRTERHSFKVRLELASGTQPGVIAMPLGLYISPG
jgi:hypothetical protein